MLSNQSNEPQWKSGRLPLSDRVLRSKQLVAIKKHLAVYTCVYAQKTSGGIHTCICPKNIWRYTRVYAQNTSGGIHVYMPKKHLAVYTCICPKHIWRYTRVYAQNTSGGIHTCICPKNIWRYIEFIRILSCMSHEVMWVTGNTYSDKHSAHKIKIIMHLNSFKCCAICKHPILLVETVQNICTRLLLASLT